MDIQNLKNIGEWLLILGGILGLWFKDYLGAKLGIIKEKGNIESVAIDNLQKNMDLYQELVSDLETRYKTRLVELEQDFQESIDRLKVDIAELTSLNDKLSNIIKKQTSRIKYYTEKYGEK